ncbi:MAG: hypothetical protein HY721_17490 [Planctomycetes bacterium]|nr:hypothetical protein [Planctomycetota bacterium]
MQHCLRARTVSWAALTVVVSACFLRAQAPSGWIQDVNWLFLGPLGSGFGCNPGDAIGSSWIAPEEISAIAPADGDPISIDFNAASSDSWEGIGEAPAWTCLASLGLPGDDLVDLTAIAAAVAVQTGETIPLTNAMAVFVTYVSNDTGSPLPVRLCTASDDSIQVWVNDQRVQEVRACRATAGGCAEEAAALLVPGTNAIKVLLWQGVGGWSFRLALKRVDSSLLTSDDAEVTFLGCEGGGSPSLSSYRVERRVGADVLECAVAGGAVEVTLDGSSSAGPNLTLTEVITGAVAIEGITGGGVFTPAPAPALGPVGTWEDARDIGGPCYPGSTVDSGGGSYTVTGGGEDIWQNGDQFQFAYKLAHGDFDMVAHVASRTWAPGSRWGKAGIMARQSLSPRSRYAGIQTHGDDPQDADRFAARPTHGGSNNFEATNLAGGEHRDWLRLSRVGSVFTGYFATDGSDWQAAGSVDWGPDAPHTVLLGLAVCSHDNCSPAELVFDSVSIAGGTANQGPFPTDGGSIIWSNLARATLDAGVGYKVRGEGLAQLFGHDGEHAVEGPSQVLLQGAASAAGIFSSAHDIGLPCFPGSTVHDAGQGTYTVTAGGADIWEGNDQFQYAYARFTGDFSIRAKIRERTWAPGSRWGKGGLMARESCAPDSRYSFLHDNPDPDGTRYAVQRISNQASNQEFGIGGHPDWLRVDRVGKVFAGYASDDGVVWTLRYKEAWLDPVPDTVLVGLALTSHMGCEPATLVFEQVSLSAIDYAVTRRAGSGLPACPEPGAGSSVTVKLKGSGPAGPNVLVSEDVAGQVDVRNISHGGVLRAPQKPTYTPLGMWQDARDIGAPCVEGSTVDVGDGSDTITGAGADIWQTGDQFQFAYVEAHGDFAFTTRISDRIWAPGSRWGKVGIMARQSHSSRSRYVSVQDHGIDLQDATRWASRPTHAGSDNYETVPLPPGTHHDWLRLERAGDTFIGSSSEDGATWIEQGRETWTDAPATVLLGLHVCSHADCLPSTITFADIEYTGGNGAPGAVPEGGTIDWNVSRAVLGGEGLSYEVVASGNKLATFSGTADGVGIAGDAEFAISPTKSVGGPFSIAHDVGSPCTAGDSEYDAGAGAYTVTGSGTDIWQTGDQFQFAYREVAGDFFVAIAHIADRQWAVGSRWGKVGIMARRDCTSRSAYAMIQDHGEDLQDASRFAARPTHGGADNFEQLTLPGGTHRDWLRLDRQGSVFTGYTSMDGGVWERQGSVDFGAGAPESVLLGLGVCGHDGCEPATIVFDEIQVITTPNNPPVPCIETDPSPPTVYLSGGKAEITLKGTCSTDGDGGTQGLSYLWLRVAGPSGAVIEDNAAAVTRVTFTKAGTYRYRLAVNDGQLTSSGASTTVEVTVSDKPPEPVFHRGDADQNGQLQLTDAIRILGFLFLGGPAPDCLDAADADDNGQLQLTDAIRILGFLFLGGVPPATPGPPPDPCGPDTAGADELGCTAYVGC